MTAPTPSNLGEPVSPDESGDVGLATAARSRVLGLSPAGLESLCKHMLTELGMTQLRTVGQAGDRGIDVEGMPSAGQGPGVRARL